MTRIPGARRSTQVVVMIGASLLVFGGVAIAQPPGKGGPPAQGQGMGRPEGGKGMGRHGGPGPRDMDQVMEHMTQRLSLNAEQQKQIRQILEERQAKAREMVAKSRESGASREERRKEFAGFREQTQAKVEAVLNEKQVEQYRQLQAERRKVMEQRREEYMEKGMGHRGPGGMGGPMGGAQKATPAKPATPAQPSKKSTEGEN